MNHGTQEDFLSCPFREWMIFRSLSHEDSMDSIIESIQQDSCCKKQCNKVPAARQLNVREVLSLLFSQVEDHHDVEMTGSGRRTPSRFRFSFHLSVSLVSLVSSEKEEIQDHQEASSSVSS